MKNGPSGRPATEATCGLRILRKRKPWPSQRGPWSSSCFSQRFLVPGSSRARHLEPALLASLAVSPWEEARVSSPSRKPGLPWGEEGLHSSLQVRADGQECCLLGLNPTQLLPGSRAVGPWLAHWR